MEFDLIDKPKSGLAIPVQQGRFSQGIHFVRKNLPKLYICNWLCYSQSRAEELFQQQIKKHDPFVNHYGGLTAVKVFTGYGNPPHDPWGM